jgi:hypothetical protein
VTSQTSNKENEDEDIPAMVAVNPALISLEKLHAERFLEGFISQRRKLEI